MYAPPLVHVIIIILLTVQILSKLMECVCFESVCGRRCCQITLSASVSTLGSVAGSPWTWGPLILLFMVYLVWPDQWLVISLLSLLTLSYTICKLVLPASECVLAVSGVGVYVSKCYGAFTLTSLFIPQTATHSVVIYEVIAKYHIHFSLGLYLHSPSNQTAIANKDTLVPLFKESRGSLSLDELQVAYKHLKETLTDKTEHEVYSR